MLIPPWIEERWWAEHTLGVDEVRWCEENADPGDVHPIVTAIELLRRSRLGVGDAFVGVAGQE
jgi:hypothetical protein